MVTHMKTTIEIADALLAEAREVAGREKTTVRALVEAGLRKALSERRQRRKPFKLRLVTSGGGSLTPGTSAELPRDLTYDIPGR